jgi:hypothetical protein
LWDHRGDLFTSLRQPGLDATTWVVARAQSVLTSVGRRIKRRLRLLVEQIRVVGNVG